MEELAASMKAFNTEPAAIEHEPAKAVESLTPPKEPVALQVPVPPAPAPMVPVQLQPQAEKVVQPPACPSAAVA